MYSKRSNAFSVPKLYDLNLETIPLHSVTELGVAAISIRTVPQ